MPKHTNRLTSEWILSLDPSVSTRTRLATAKDVIFPRDGTDPLSETLKLLAVSIVQRRNVLLSFQTIKVIAAIFRAKVRRAIEGLMPLVSKAW